MTKQIFIISGEASGDLHGAKLATALLRADPDLKLEGVGGRLMKAAGVKLLADIRDLGVVGVVEVLSHLSSIWNVYQKVREKLRREAPDLVIFIDYPDFNLRMARVARRMNIPAVYYISPQIWAWRQGRIKTIAKLIDKMLVIFQFEKEFYDAAGLDCEFVGHPLLDDLKILPTRAQLRNRLGLDPDRPTVGLLPGSRYQEVSRLLPMMLSAMKRLKDRIPTLQLVLAAAPSLETGVVESIVSASGQVSKESGLEVLVVADQSNEVIAASDAVVVASGTATLQAAILETPMVIVYKVFGLTYLLARMLVHTKHIGLANLVAGERIVPELLQSRVTAKTMEHEVYKMLTDPVYTEGIKKGLAQVKARLGLPGASARAAKTILDFLGSVKKG
jgi:lipid-A-disaccharide synthase